VADRGPGLPEGGDQKMFEPFTRGVARQSEHGSGLGLAIVAAAAQAHGGRAWYEPRPGGGSVFRIRVPRRGEPQAPNGE
jgi:signal transduction histidine kinase